MGTLQKEAIAAYDKIKAERGEVTFIDAFVAGFEQAREGFKAEIEKRIAEYAHDGKNPNQLAWSELQALLVKVTE